MTNPPELPPLVAEFVDKSTRLVRLRGTVRRDIDNKLMLSLVIAPLFFLAYGEDFQELYVSCPPNMIEDPDPLRFRLYEYGAQGLHYNEQLIERFLPSIDRWLILDALAGV